MRITLKRILSFIHYIEGLLIGAIFYRKVLSHKDYCHVEDPGWDRIRRAWFGQKIRGKNKRAIWPVSALSLIGEPTNLIIDESSEGNLMTSGLYLQCMDAKTIIGKDVFIAPNVGIITCNHDTNNPSEHLRGKDVIIGDNCWIGMNAVILPGVVLGGKTTVGAGAVVTKSFPEGNCVIAGNPARIIRKLEESDND